MSRQTVMPALALVTGAPGWLGTRLVAALAGGRDVRSFRPVRCLVQRPRDTAALRAVAPGVDTILGDLTSTETLAPLFREARGATLFHAAGLIHPSHGTRDLYAVNVDGTRAVIEAATRADVRRLIYVSSNSPAGTNPQPDHRFDEQAPYRPYMTYGKTKMLAEKLVLAAHAAGHLEGVIVRPTWFYGPGQPQRQTRFFSMIRRGTVPLVGHGRNCRSLSYVDDVCEGLLLCESVAAAAGQTYWMADGRPYPMLEIIETIERVMERDLGLSVARRKIRVPAVASDIARVVDRGLQALGGYNQEIHVLSEMNATIACSIEKAQRELGYQPSVGLEEGMRRSIEWVLRTGGVL